MRSVRRSRPHAAPAPARALEGSPGHARRPRPGRHRRRRHLDGTGPAHVARVRRPDLRIVLPRPRPARPGRRARRGPPGPSPPGPGAPAPRPARHEPRQGILAGAGADRIRRPQRARPRGRAHGPGSRRRRRRHREPRRLPVGVPPADRRDRRRRRHGGRHDDRHRPRDRGRRRCDHPCGARPAPAVGQGSRRQGRRSLGRLRGSSRRVRRLHAGHDHSRRLRRRRAGGGPNSPGPPAASWSGPWASFACP